MEDVPLHFVLHQCETLLTHNERVGHLDETLDLTERVSGGRSLCSLDSANTVDLHEKVDYS